MHTLLTEMVEQNIFGMTTSAAPRGEQIIVFYYFSKQTTASIMPQCSGHLFGLHKPSYTTPCGTAKHSIVRLPINRKDGRCIAALSTRWSVDRKSTRLNSSHV